MINNRKMKSTEGNKMCRFKVNMLCQRLWLIVNNEAKDY